MSLIADALKAAQKARSKDAPGEARARRVVAAGQAPIRVGGARGRGTLPPSVLAAGGLLAVALAVLLGVVLLRPGPEEAPHVAAAERQAPEPTARAGQAAPEADAVPGRGGEPRPGDRRTVTPGPARSGVQPTAPRPEPSTQVAGASSVDMEPPPVASVALDEPSPRFRLSVEPRPAAGQLFRRGVEAHRRGAYGEAVGYYRAALEETPADAEILNNLGTAYRSMGRLADAETHFRRAIAVDPTYAAAWSNLGVVLDGQGREEDAVAAYREALRHDPDNAGAKVNLAQAYQGLGMTGQARAMLQEVLTADPASSEAHYALGRVLDAAGDAAGAIQHYQAFLTTSRGQFPALEPAVRRRLDALRGAGRNG